VDMSTSGPANEDNELPQLLNFQTNEQLTDSPTQNPAPAIPADSSERIDEINILVAEIEATCKLTFDDFRQSLLRSSQQFMRDRDFHRHREVLITTSEKLLHETAIVAEKKVRGPRQFDFA